MAYFMTSPLSWEGAPGLAEDTPSAPWVQAQTHLQANDLVLDSAGYYVDCCVLGHSPEAAELEILGSCESIVSNGTDLSSSEDTDPDWRADGSTDKDCHFVYHCTTDKSRLQKNLKERERVQLKKDSLKRLVSYLKRSEFIRDSDKKKRFTEAYTVRMTTTLIQALERENERLGGKKIAVRPSRARKIHKKKPSNTFIKFSTSYRPLFVKVLKKLMQSLNTGSSSGLAQSTKNPSQKVVQKLAAEVWNRLPQATKSTEQEWENYVSEVETSELARGILC